MPRKKRKKTRSPASNPALSTQHETITVDFSFDPFRDDVAEAEPRVVEDLTRLAAKLGHMTWAQVYATSSKGAHKRGVNWEPLHQWTSTGKQVHTIRVNEKCRARVIRDGAVMRFISLHESHDEAYRDR